MSISLKIISDFRSGKKREGKKRFYLFICYKPRYCMTLQPKAFLDNTLTSSNSLKWGSDLECGRRTQIMSLHNIGPQKAYFIFYLYWTKNRLFPAAERKHSRWRKRLNPWMGGDVPSPQELKIHNPQLCCLQNFPFSSRHLRGAGLWDVV